MKIITFTKNNQFQALLQFSDPVNAQQAKLVGSHPYKIYNCLIYIQLGTREGLFAFNNYSFHKALTIIGSG